MIRSPHFLKHVLRSKDIQHCRSLQTTRVCFQKHNSDRNNEESFLDIQIDRSGLLSVTPKETIDPKILQQVQNQKPKERSKATPLVPFLNALMDGRGPISVAEFMRQALTHPAFGYYIHQEAIGTKGDFTTAPEISQMFGELIGVWCVATWMQMGKPDTFNLVELGPGRGALQSDLLSAARSFPEFYKAINLHLVDVSPRMRKLQQEAIGCIPEAGIEENHEASQELRNGKIPDGPTVQWHSDMSSVPEGPSIIVAQELFDALPIHQFEYTEKGWCERLVDVDYGMGEDHFRFVLSPGATPAVRAYLGNERVHKLLQSRMPDPGKEDSMESISEPEPVISKEAAIGDRLEVCPEGIALVQDISNRISKDGGAALIIDYGHDHASADSLRGIKDHEFVRALLQPGEIDLSADVDFSTLRHFAAKKENVNAYGPITQGLFLKEMGIEHRLAALLESCTCEEMAQTLVSSYERLVDENQMGSIFKTLAIVNKEVGVPVAFSPPSHSE